jgi:mannose-binding lectin 2
MLEHLSLTPPYDDVDYNGERLPGKGFRSSGTTVVNSNFIRLTPDRQSKKGALWSKAAVVSILFALPCFFLAFLLGF